MNNTKSGWEVKTCEVSQRSALFITGTNHESTDPLFREFSWHVNADGLKDSRYDFSGCTFTTGAWFVFSRIAAPEVRATARP